MSSSEKRWSTGLGSRGPTESSASGADAGVCDVSRLRYEVSRLEKMLRLAEAKHRALVVQIPGIVYVAAVGDYGTARYVSPNIEEILGITPDAWVANPCSWLERIHPADRERVLERLSWDRQPDDPPPIEYRILDCDGTVRWFRESVSLLRDRDGRPCLLQGVLLEMPAPPVEAAELPVEAAAMPTEPSDLPAEPAAPQRPARARVSR